MRNLKNHTDWAPPLAGHLSRQLVGYNSDAWRSIFSWVCDGAATWCVSRTSGIKHGTGKGGNWGRGDIHPQTLESISFRARKEGVAFKKPGRNPTGMPHAHRKKIFAYRTVFRLQLQCLSAMGFAYFLLSKKHNRRVSLKHQKNCL